jgi:tetratricopeptide (TPR) repeat protein
MSSWAAGPANLGFEDGSGLDGRPSQWGGGGEGYELAADPSVRRVQGTSGRIRSVGQRGPEGFGTLTQCFAADRFRGTVVRYSGFLKTADVQGWAGLWMRVDGDASRSLRFDNMATPRDRSIAGTTGWTQCEIVLDIPAEATDVCLGFLLTGTGTVWADDLDFEILDGVLADEVLAGIRLHWPRQEPANLDFEDGNGPGGQPSHWGGGGKGYELAADPSVSRVQGTSGRIRSVGQRGPEGFGFMTQCFAADRLRGTVVRYSGFLKTADVRGWAGLWMRADGATDDAVRKTLRLDNMATPVDRSIAGTTDWAQCEIVLDIPAEATQICLGFLLDGSGTMWADDLDFEVLEPARDRPTGLRGAASVQSLTQRPPARAAAPGMDEAWSTPPRAGDSASAGSAADELFLGRALEQREFERLLTELSRAPKRNGRAWPHVVIVHGIGGIGKTRLAERFRGIASAGAQRDRYEVVAVDWADVATRDRAFAARPGPSFEAILDKLEQACSRDGRLARHFEQYRQLRIRIANARAGADRSGGAAGDARPDTTVGRSARMLGSALQAGEVIGVPPGIGEATQVAGAAADALSALWKTGESWRRDRLDHGDYELLVRPLDALASAFASGLAGAASRRPIVLLADTCEIVAPAGPWLRVLMRQTGPRVAWLLFGRFEADPPGWPAGLSSSSDPVPSGRLSELDAYRKDVPGDRLRIFELGAFDAGMLRAYLQAAAPQRPAGDAEIGRLHTATAGIPLAVRLAMSLWGRGTPIEMIADPVPISANRRTVVEGMTRRFLVHLSAEDKEKIHGLALILYPDDADLVAAVWATDRVIEAFESLAQRYDFVLAGQFRLHDTIHAFLLRYLLDGFHRAEARPVNQRAAAFFEQRLQARQQALPTLERRMADPRWVSDMLALAWHRFWIDNSSGWATLLAAFPAAIAYNPSAGRALLDLAGRLVPSTAPVEQRRLRLLRGTLGPMTALFEQAGAESLSELAGDAARAPVEPDDGCGSEREAILEWLHGQRALHDGDLIGALEHLTGAASLSPEAAGRLRRWISRSLLDLNQRLPWESPAARPDPDQAPYSAAARLALELEPGNPEAQQQWGRVLHHMGRDDEALAALDAAIELDPHDADLHIDRGEILRHSGRYAEALDAANRVIQLSPSNARAVASRGATYRLAGRYEEALRDLSDAVGDDYEEPWVLLNRGLVHLAQGDHEKALADVGKAIDLDAEYSVGFRIRGQIYYQRGQYEEALADHDHAIALDPGDAGAAADRDAIYDEAQKATLLREWIGRAPDPAASAAFLAGHAQDLTDPLTIELLDADCFREPADRRLWQHLGLLLLGDEAADGYAEASASDPSPVQRAASLLAAGDLDRALAWSCLARAAEPGMGALLMSQVQIRRGHPDAAGEALATAADAIDPERLAEVLAAYDDLLATQPDEPWRHAEHAEALRHAGKPAEAIAAYNQAISLTPDDPSLHFNKGQILFGLSRLDEAKTEFLAVTQLRPSDVLSAAVLLAAIAWPDNTQQARQNFQRALSSPGEQLTPFGRAYYRAIALSGLGRTDEAVTGLQAAAGTRTAREMRPDDTNKVLLERFRDPPLPGLDQLRPFLECNPTAAEGQEDEEAGIFSSVPPHQHEVNDQD